MTPLFRRSRSQADDATDAPLAPYRLLPEPAPITDLDTWPRLHQQYTHVLGWSLLGHGFLVHAGTGEHAVLHPLADGLKSYGCFASTAEFRAQVLDDEGFCDYVLQPWLVERVRARIGDPAANQVYLPVPYPFLGGSGEPDTYDKGDVWVFWSIVGGMFLGD